MLAPLRARREVPRAARFDVICAGEVAWKISPELSLEPGGGAASVALALARRGFRVGLAAVLPDDAAGDRCLEKLAASGVDVGGVLLVPERASLVVVDASGTANPSHPFSDAPTLELPREWTSQILLLSGLSPHLPQAAALCRAARAARRQGSFVFLDADANLRAWAGRDPRTVRMLLREIDVARCGVTDLAVLGMDVRSMRNALRPSAVLVLDDAARGVVANGPFGEVAYTPPDARAVRARGAGDACTAAICSELMRRGKPGESPVGRWHRALAAAHAERYLASKS
ncbi:hypothetical protein BH09MYX1_BH09MYX1_07180 [soil metagenome]